jgi:hypothetical protein
LLAFIVAPPAERQGFRQVPVAELVAALTGTFQVLYYDRRGWLPTEVAWRREVTGTWNLPPFARWRF